MLALALASCGAYKRYERPAQAVEGLERLYGPDTTATDTASIASLPWTELFTDPALQALIREGLANNTDLGSKYIGAGENHAVKLSKMGGAEWQRTKTRAKAAAKKK